MNFKTFKEALDFLEKLDKDIHNVKDAITKLDTPESVATQLLLKSLETLERQRNKLLNGSRVEEIDIGR
jgi:hypothetical protein